MTCLRHSRSNATGSTSTTAMVSTRVNASTTEMAPTMTTRRTRGSRHRSSSSRPQVLDSVLETQRVAVERAAGDKDVGACGGRGGNGVGTDAAVDFEVHLVGTACGA